MITVNATLILEVQRTKTRLLVFDQHYQLLLCEEDTCTDISRLDKFVFKSTAKILNDKRFRIRGINFTANGDSLILLDNDDRIIQFHPGCCSSQQKTSPVLVRDVFYNTINRLKYILHLPQYMSFLVTGKPFSEISSLGSHSCMWDFERHCFHRELESTTALTKLPELVNSNHVIRLSYSKYLSVGVGIANHTAALLPYMQSVNDQFVLLITGKKSCSLNPFNQQGDNYNSILSHDGKCIRASRFALGLVHDRVVREMNLHFHIPSGYHRSKSYDPLIMVQLYKKRIEGGMELYNEDCLSGTFSLFDSYDEAYHHFMTQLVKTQVKHLKKVMTPTVKKIIVEGGFRFNHLMMHLLTLAFPACQVYGSDLDNSSAIGAAMILNLSDANAKRKPVASLTRFSPSVAKATTPQYAAHH